jgi:hypothetical protein
MKTSSILLVLVFTIFGSSSAEARNITLNRAIVDTGGGGGVNAGGGEISAPCWYRGFKC